MSLDGDLYQIDDAIYRRPPYRGATTENNNLPVSGGYTKDLFNDDDHEEKYADNEDSPACGMEAPPGLAVHPVSSGAPAPPPIPPSTGLPQWITDRDSRVVQDAEGKWNASIEVDPKFYGLLIGAKYATANEMQDATQCRIIFPKKDSDSHLIRVRSFIGKDNVTSCLDRIEAIVHPKIVYPKDKIPYIKKTSTHFATIPCNDPWVRQRFLTFKELMMTGKEVHPSCQVEALFPSKMKLHLTICMLHLETDEEKELATKTMAIISEKYAERSPLEVRIDGFDIMTGDPTKVHVLFAKVHGEGVQELVNEIRDELLKAELISKVDKRNVRLHMTLMNSRYASMDENGNPSFDYKDRTSFDASWIMREHYDWDFGSFTLNRLTICTLHTEDETTGYYECLFDEITHDQQEISRYTPTMRTGDSSDDEY